MRAAGGAMPVEHRRQQDDFDSVVERRQRLGRALGDALPIRLAVEELVEQRGDFILIDNAPARLLGDVSGQSEGRQGEAKALCFEEFREGPDEFQKHVVDVEHQKRPVIGRQFGDLAQCFGIVAHMDLS